MTFGNPTKPTQKSQEAKGQDGWEPARPIERDPRCRIRIVSGQRKTATGPKLEKPSPGYSPGKKAKDPRKPWVSAHQNFQNVPPGPWEGIPGSGGPKLGSANQRFWRCCWMVPFFVVFKHVFGWYLFLWCSNMFLDRVPLPSFFPWFPKKKPKGQRTMFGGALKQDTPISDLNSPCGLTPGLDPGSFQKHPASGIRPSPGQSNPALLPFG